MSKLRHKCQSLIYQDRAARCRTFAKQNCYSGVFRPFFMKLVREYTTLSTWEYQRSL